MANVDVIKTPSELESLSIESRKSRGLIITRITPDFESLLEQEGIRAAQQGVLPLVFDHSMYSTMQSCPRKGLLAYIMHLKSRSSEWPLTSGTAVHAAAEVRNKMGVRLRRLRAFQGLEGAEVRDATWEDNWREYIKNAALLRFTEEAVKDEGLPRFIKDELPRKPHSIERLYKLVARFLTDCPFENEFWVVEDEDDVECGFAIAVAGFIFVGRMDIVVRVKNAAFLPAPGQLAVVDYKSTTKMGVTYADQWNPQNAFTGYMHATSELKGEKCRQGFVHCLQFNKNIESVENYFPLTRTDLDIEEWQEEMKVTFGQIQEMYERWLEKGENWKVVAANGGEEGPKAVPAGLEDEAGRSFDLRGPALTAFPKNTGHCNFWRKPCTYARICAAGNAEMRQKTAEGDFEVKPWLPYEELGDRGIGVADD